MPALVQVRHNELVRLAVYSISLGGAYLVGPLTVRVGERLRVHLELEGAALELSGEVVRTNVIDAMTDQVAIRFLDVSDENAARLRSIVSALLEPRPSEL
jgi:hypothetical protein